MEAGTAFSSDCCYYSGTGSVGETSNSPALVSQSARASSELRTPEPSSVNASTPTASLAASTSSVQSRQRLAERRARTGPSSPNNSFTRPTHPCYVPPDEFLGRSPGYYQLQPHGMLPPHLPNAYWPAQHVMVSSTFILLFVVETVLLD